MQVRRYGSSPGPNPVPVAARVDLARVARHDSSSTRDYTKELRAFFEPGAGTPSEHGGCQHVLAPGDIPVVASNRGGQVTYHGPGQLVGYPLLDLQRRGLGIRDLVSLIENAMIATLARYGIEAFARTDAPGASPSAVTVSALAATGTARAATARPVPRSPASRSNDGSVARPRLVLRSPECGPLPPM